MALSNKDFIGETLGVELSERLEGTLAATAMAAAGGARVFRVHEGGVHPSSSRHGGRDPGTPCPGTYGSRSGMSITGAGPTRVWADANSWRTIRVGRSPSSNGRRVAEPSRWCCPALNEEDTVAAVVDTIHPLLGGLVDELIVLDSGSTDRTAERCSRGRGATVISRESAVPSIPPTAGKGEVAVAVRSPQRPAI